MKLNLIDIGSTVLFLSSKPDKPKDYNVGVIQEYNITSEETEVTILCRDKEHKDSKEFDALYVVPKSQIIRVCKNGFIYVKQQNDIELNEDESLLEKYCSTENKDFVIIKRNIYNKHFIVLADLEEFSECKEGDILKCVMTENLKNVFKYANKEGYEFSYDYSVVNKLPIKQVSSYAEDLIEELSKEKTREIYEYLTT